MLGFTVTLTVKLRTNAFMKQGRIHGSPLAGGWAGAVMCGAGAVISWAGAVMSWAGAVMSLAGAEKAVRILKAKALPTDRPTDQLTQ